MDTGDEFHIERGGRADYRRLLLRHNAKVDWWILSFTRRPEMIRLLLSHGWNVQNLNHDVCSSFVTQLVWSGVNRLRSGTRLSKSFISKFMSEIEISLLREIAFATAVRIPGCHGYVTFYRIRDFITFHGMFLADDYTINNEKSGCVWHKGSAAECGIDHILIDEACAAFRRVSVPFYTRGAVIG